MIFPDDRHQEIRKARIKGSRKTSFIPFEEIERVLVTLEKEAAMSKKERLDLVKVLYEDAAGRDYTNWRDRCRTKMSIGTWRLLLIIAFPLYTGFRRSDCIKVKWGDILTFGPNQEVMVRPSVTILEQKTQKFKTKRTIPLGPEIAYYIMKYYMTAKPRDFDTYVFVSRSKSTTPHLTGPGYCNMINHAFARFGVYDQDGKVAPHSLRKSYSEYIWRKFGRSFEGLLKLQKILGHSTIDMTIKYLSVDVAESNQVHNEISFRGAGIRP